jgi:hypothetical protein
MKGSAAEHKKKGNKFFDKEEYRHAEKEFT